MRPTPQDIISRIRATTKLLRGCKWRIRSFFNLLYLFSALVPTLSQAQLVQPDVVVAKSRSGQFVIHSKSSAALSAQVSNLQRDFNFVRLDPALLTVSCERIKQILWRELRAPDTWSGKVFINVYPVSSRDDPIMLSSTEFRDGWQYELTLPSILERGRYVRAIARVLLLELANRKASEHSAELPLWLVEGLSEQLLRSSQVEIILPPPEESGASIRLSSVVVNARKDNPLEHAHVEMCAGRPLSFQQLSWPEADQLVGRAGELYRSSAQLFVSELLGLTDGRACLLAMLRDLPQYYNWQFAFFHAFQNHSMRIFNGRWILRSGGRFTWHILPGANWSKPGPQMRVGTNWIKSSTLQSKSAWGPMICRCVFRYRCKR